MEAVGLAVGVVSLGLELSTKLQTYIEGVKGAKESLTELSVDVSSTASTLKQLANVIEADKAVNRQETLATASTLGADPERAGATNDDQSTDYPVPKKDTSGANSVLTEEAQWEIESLARRCETVYYAIIRVLVSATSPSGKGGRRALSANIVGIGDLTASRIRKLGQKLVWPWLEPRLKACQQQLGGLKLSLLLRLQVATLAAIQMRYVELC